MEKRTFLKLSSALLTGTVLSPVISCAPDKKMEKIHNWAGNLEYGTDSVLEPRTVEEVQDLVKKLDKLRVLGTRHSFNTIADSKDNLVSTKNLNQIISLDKEKNTVTVESGIRYGQLAEYLQSNGFALHNLASLPHISVAGAIATATHGSGVKNGNLSTAIAGLELVRGSGDVIMLTREKDGEKFSGAVVGLGALGMVTKVTLDIQPTFEVRQDIYENMPLAQLETHLDEVLGAGYSVSLFTDWRNQNINQVWIKRRVEPGQQIKLASEFLGATIATQNLHPIREISAVNCTDQMGVPGPWHERLPHFKMNFTPSSGAELQAEYFVPYANAFAAMSAISSLSDQISPHLLISEVRTIDGDNLWMSPCYKEPSLAIHFTWKPDWPNVSKVLPLIEEKLSPFNAKPHWGKLFTMAPAALQSRYEKLTDFKALISEYDPNGKFRNEFLERNLFGAGA